jgi:ketosteroid isomerase-like protein
MRTIKAVVLVCISTTLLIVAQSSDPTLEKELLAVLHPIYAAEQRHDLAYVKSHLDEDFAEVAGDGNVYGFNDIEKGFAEMQLNHYALTNCIARAMGVNAAYLTCRMEVEASYQGTPLPKEMRVTWLWKKSVSGWKVSFEQATLIPAK